ncbi:MAG: murein biosynthesis integral membrane protein MurJ [Bradymonadaceae bacterium]
MDSNDNSSSGGEAMGLAALLLAASIFASRLLGFVREAAVAYLHGASRATDAYYAAFTLPDLLNYFLAGGTLTITFIPLFQSYLTDDDESGGWTLFSNIATTMGGLLVLFVIVLEVVAPYAVPVLNPGFDSTRQIELAVWMTRIVIPAQLAFYLGGLIKATLYVRKVFWPQAIAPLVYNVCIILGGVLLNPVFGIAGFAIGALVGAFLGPLGIPMWAARGEIRYSPTVDPSHPDFRRFVKLTIPLMIGVGLLTVDQWLLRYFGSHIEGAITWLNDGRKLMLVVFAIVGQATGQAALPYLTELYHEEGVEALGERLSQTLQHVGFLAVVGAAGLLVAAEPIVFLVFRRGAFTVADARHTATVLTWFAFGLPGWAVQSIAARGFYARRDTLTPMLVSTGMVVVAIPIYATLFDRYGAPGLAASTSIGITLNAIATVAIFRVKSGELPLTDVLWGLLRGLAAGSACSAAAWGARRGLAAAGFATDLDVLLHTIGLLAAMGAAFFITAILIVVAFDPPEARYVRQRLREKIG